MADQLFATVTLIDPLAGKAFRGVAPGAASAGDAPVSHELILDSAPQNGGQSLGFRPMTLLALGLAGCSGMTLIAILRKMRQVVTSYEVRVLGERSESPPRLYQHLVVEHILAGEDLPADKVARALKLAEAACPVSLTLSRATSVSHSFRIVMTSTTAPDASLAPESAAGPAAETDGSGSGLPS